MTLDQAIDEIADSPDFFDVVDDLQRRREAEEAARIRFTASLREDAREEFIAGKVIRLMPTRKRHQDIVAAISEVMRTFTRLAASGDVRGEQALVRLARNDYLPDVCFWPRSIARRFAKDQAIFPPPTWVVEVLSPDTAKRDRGVKFRDYAANGVVEYWIVDADAEVIEQYRNVDGTFTLVKKHTAGTIRGVAIPTFSMPVRAAFDEAANARHLKKLWSTPAKKK